MFRNRKIVEHRPHSVSREVVVMMATKLLPNGLLHSKKPTHERLDTEDFAILPGTSLTRICIGVSTHC